ncbi:probable G-protein coupled receptor 139 [Heterodontus francisci]|uniref:probable G-protein coupled receptor 139 n=1 Tax=Heterodontus francisci TaxID=7792 RepID=UPI00355B65D9
MLFDWVFMRSWVVGVADEASMFCPHLNAFEKVLLSTFLNFCSPWGAAADYLTAIDYAADYEMSSLWVMYLPGTIGEYQRESYRSVQPVRANLVTIIILSRGNCGLSKCISVYMVAMATVDLLVMLINIIVFYILRNRFPHSFLSYTAVYKFMVYIRCNNLMMSVWFTVSLTFDRFVAICYQKFKTKYCTVRTATVVVTTVSVLIYLYNLPNWFAYEAKQTIDNVQWGLRPSQDFFSSPAGRAFFRFQCVLLPWIPFVLILLFNCLTVGRILVASRRRRMLRGHSSENQSDPEVENRRKSIILLFTISGTFILLWFTSSVSYLVNGMLIHVRPDYTDPAYIATQTGSMLMDLSSCTNTCIYAAIQTKFREELKKLAKSPWTIIQILVKKYQNKIKAPGANCS